MNEVVYRHRQIGTLTFYTLGGSSLALGILAVTVARDEPTNAWGMVAVLIVLLLCTYLFSSLTVELSRDQLRWWFGPGWIHQRCDVQDIERVNVVKNRWYYGWGIRITPHGWLYNVSGFDAVEIVLRSRVKFRIGTDQAQQLSAAIQAAIDSQHSAAE